MLKKSKAKMLPPPWVWVSYCTTCGTTICADYPKKCRTSCSVCLAGEGRVAYVKFVLAPNAARSRAKLASRTKQLRDFIEG